MEESIRIILNNICTCMDILNTSDHDILYQNISEEERNRHYESFLYGLELLTKQDHKQLCDSCIYILHCARAIQTSIVNASVKDSTHLQVFQNYWECLEEIADHCHRIYRKLGETLSHYQLHRLISRFQFAQNLFMDELYKENDDCIVLFDDLTQEFSYLSTFCVSARISPHDKGMKLQFEITEDAHLKRLYTAKCELLRQDTMCNELSFQIRLHNTSGMCQLSESQNWNHRSLIFVFTIDENELSQLVYDAEIIVNDTIRKTFHLCADPLRGMNQDLDIERCELTHID